MSTKRYYVIDYIRAFVILNMILYHTIWDIVYIFNMDIYQFKDIQGKIWQRFICIAFILLCGFCWSLSKNHLKRGLITFALGGAISIVTYIFVPENVIRYGILTMLGSAILIMIPLEKILNKVNEILGFVASILLYVIFKDINNGYIFFSIVKVPKFLYSGEFMTYLGFTEEGFYSSDYFSILPWIFIFIGGYFLKVTVEKRNCMDMLKGVPNAFIEAVSRNSIYIYVIHQPVIYGVLNLILR